MAAKKNDKEEMYEEAAMLRYMVSRIHNGLNSDVPMSKFYNISEESIEWPNDLGRFHFFMSISKSFKVFLTEIEKYLYIIKNSRDWKLEKEEKEYIKIQGITKKEFIEAVVASAFTQILALTSLMEQMMRLVMESTNGATELAPFFEHVVTLDAHISSFIRHDKRCTEAFKKYNINNSNSVLIH